MNFFQPRSFSRWLAVLVTFAIGLQAARAMAQESTDGNPATNRQARLDDAEKRAQDALAAPADSPPASATPAAAESGRLSTTDLFSLWWEGGLLMYPITLMSVLVVLFTVERAIGLRRRKVIPTGLVTGLTHMQGRDGDVDPEEAFRLCQQHPSTAATVLKSVLVKLGRPHSELEHTVQEVSEREAARLYRNVRTINLAVTVTPLLGLLGTVQGMIECFYVTANLPTTANKTESLANGIYIALLTTFGGLMVAIPAAVISHYFEGRIQALFREIDELVMSVLPHWERYEGRERRPARDGNVARDDSPGSTSARRPPAERAVPADRK